MSLFYPVPPGDDHIGTFQSSKQINSIVWHGSSLPLIAKGTTLLNEQFSESNPEEDFSKYIKIGAQPYFLAVAQETEKYELEILCLLRCILDGEDWVYNDPSSAHDNDDSPFSQRRIVIDYLCTLPEYQGRGYAGHLLELVTQFSLTQRANCYVVAIEEACVYWMANGFILEEDKLPNERLNRFSDCFLLKLPSNRPEDPMRCSKFPESDSEDDSDDDDGSDGSSSSGSSSDSSSGSDDESDYDDAELQKAILKSIGMQ